MQKRISPKTKFYIGLIMSLAAIAAVVNYQYYKESYLPSLPKFRPGAEEKDYVRVFTDIYATNEWEDGSGLGSNPVHARPYMVLLQDLLFDPRITTIVDIGCGDWQIMRNMTLPQGKSYVGYDVVENLIETNKQAYTRDNVHFEHTLGLQDLAQKNVSGDLLIMKDVMQHWPIEEIQYFIKNILPRFKYAIITNQYEPNKRGHNKDKQMGPVHSIGLLESPFKLRYAIQLMEYDGPDHKQVIFYQNPNLQ